MTDTVSSVLNFFMGPPVAPPTSVVDRVSNVQLDSEQCVLRLEYFEGILYS